MAPNAPQGSPELSKLDILNGLFDKAQAIMKASIGARQKPGIDPLEGLIALEDKAREFFGVPKLIFGKKFDLGEYKVTPDELKDVKIEGKHVYSLVGRVDQVAFDEAKTRGADWYVDLQKDAELFLKVKDRIKIDFPELWGGAKYVKMMNIIGVMSTMSNFNDSDWKKMIADNKYTDDEIYGAEGAYNLLLAFQRAIAPVDRNALLNPPNVTLDATDPSKPVTIPQLAKIRLGLSGKKVKSDEDRFSGLIGVEVKEKVAEGVTDPDYTYELSADQKKLTLTRTVKGKKYSKKYSIDNPHPVVLRVGSSFDGNDRWITIVDGDEFLQFEVDPKDGQFKLVGESKKRQYRVNINGETIEILKVEASAPAAAPAQTPPPAAPETPKAPEASAQPNDFLKIQPMAQLLGEPANGFKLDTVPNNFGESAYATHGGHRLEITFVSGGKYGYKLLSRQQSIDNAGGVIQGETTNVEDIKKAIEKEPFDQNKVMVLDLEHVHLEKQISQNIIQKIDVKSVIPVAGKDGRYTVTVQTKNYQIGTDVYKPFEVKLLVEFPGGTIYKAYEAKTGLPVGADNDDKNFIESAVTTASTLLLRDKKIEKQ